LDDRVFVELHFEWRTDPTIFCAVLMLYQ